MRRLTFVLATLATVLGACGDDPKNTTPAEKTGTLRTTLGFTSREDEVTHACFDVEIRNGENAVVASRERACITPDAGLDFSETCVAEPGRLTHTVTVRLVAAFLEGETTFAPGTTGPADLALVDDPCVNGCAVQVSCTPSETREANFATTVNKMTRQGFFDVAVEGEVGDEDLMICYSLDIVDGEGVNLMGQRTICSSEYGNNASAITYVAPCNALPDAAANTITVGLVGVFRTVPEDFDPQNPGPGVKAEYAFDCDDCTRSVTCVQNSDISVSFAPTIRRVYLPGTVAVDVTNTLSGEGSEAVAGGCYSLDVVNANGDALIGQPGLCSVFNAATDGGPADMAFSGPCDGTPYPDDADGTTTNHVATLRVLSLHDAANAPAAAGQTPVATLEGWTNPCPAETGCTQTFACPAGEATFATFAIETVFAPAAE